MIQLNDNNINQPKISLFIHLPVFKTQILKEQYDCIFLILNHTTKYKKFQNGFYQIRKFKYALNHKLIFLIFSYLFNFL